MNFVEKLALFFGFRKFEEFAQANPTMPDDVLQIANTLDTHSTRAAAMLIAGAIAHSLDNVLHGTESVNLLIIHLLAILAGVMGVLIRHAVSAHDVQVNNALQATRKTLGIASPVVKAASVIALLFALLFFSGCYSYGQTNNGPSILDLGASQIAASAEAAPVATRVSLPKLTLIEKMPQISNGWTLVSTIFQVTTVDGVYSAISDGERGPGIATIAAIFPIDTPDEGMRLLFGPALVTCDAKDARRVLGEFGVTSKILNGAIVQATLLKVPVLGEVIKVTTLDFTDFYFYAGAGLALDVEVNHLDRGYCGSAGAGGIGFGKGAN